MVTLGLFLPSLHSIVWEKEEMCSEEERGMTLGSLLVALSVWAEARLVLS